MNDAIKLGQHIASSLTPESLFGCASPEWRTLKCIPLYDLKANSFIPVFFNKQKTKSIIKTSVIRNNTHNQNQNQNQRIHSTGTSALSRLSRSVDILLNNNQNGNQNDIDTHNQNAIDYIDDTESDDSFDSLEFYDVNNIDNDDDISYTNNVVYKTKNKLYKEIDQGKKI